MQVEMLLKDEGANRFFPYYWRGKEILTNVSQQGYWTAESRTITSAFTSTQSCLSLYWMLITQQAHGVVSSIAANVTYTVTPLTDLSSTYAFNLVKINLRDCLNASVTLSAVVPYAAMQVICLFVMQ